VDERSDHADVFVERRDKLEAWRATGEAYPTRSTSRATRSPRCGPLYESLEPGQDSGAVHRVAGRVMARRVHGKVSFVVVKDASGELQLFAQLDALGEERYAALEDLDLGDHVGAEGTVMRTRRGELSLRVTSWQLLSKSLRPLPEKFHGLTDVELRYRKRYLDTLVNDESREVFVQRATIIGRSATSSTHAASSRSRPRCCSRSTAAPWRGRSSPITTSSSATSTCASRPSST
jgi:lysyl-tRNA synthetase, class II